MKKFIYCVLGGLMLAGLTGGTSSFAGESNLGKWADKIDIGIILEGEASYSTTDLDTGGDETGSDIVLATAELDIGVDIHEKVHGQLNFLWEEDETDFADPDVAMLTIGDFNGVKIDVGKMYVPFGMFNSHMITDPMTLALGETNETAIIVSYVQDVFTVSAGLFNGSVDDADDATSGDNPIDDFVAAVHVTPVKGVTVGASFISDLSDADSDILGGGPYTERVAGVGVFASVTFGLISLEAEFIGATDEFAAADLDGDSNATTLEQPQAWNVEIAYSINDRLELAGRVEGNNEFFGNPEIQYGATASYQIWEGITGAVELLHGEYADEDTTNEDVTTATAQLAVEWP